VVYSRLGCLLARYPSFLGLSLRPRIAVALLELSREFGVPDTRGILIRIPLSQRQIAGLVGASRPKVGRVLMDLERQNAIARGGRRVTVVSHQLEIIAGSATPK
jgi:CRP-like cAMP-binding protein